MKVLIKDNTAKKFPCVDRSSQNIDTFTLANITTNDLVSANFTIGDLIKSDLAARRSIYNGFRTDEQLRAAIYVCRNILQPIRNTFGPFKPNSVFRSQALERVLKNKPATWTSKSQHTRGEACDIEIPQLTTLGLAEWVAVNMHYDQLILECYTPGKPSSGWVHISLVTGINRKEVLTFDGKIYTTGIKK